MNFRSSTGFETDVCVNRFGSIHQWIYRLIEQTNIQARLKINQLKKIYRSQKISRSTRNCNKKETLTTNWKPFFEPWIFTIFHMNFVNWLWIYYTHWSKFFCSVCSLRSPEGHTLFSLSLLEFMLHHDFGLRTSKESLSII